MNKLKWLLDPRPWILAVLIQISSLHNYYISSTFRKLPFSVLIIGLILAAAYILYFHSAAIHRLVYKLLNSYITLAILILVIWVFGFIFYPVMDGLNKSGTGDDEMQQPILAMMDGRWLYDVRLHDGAPVSLGLGWLVLNAPFTIFHVNSLFYPFYLGLMSALYIKARKRVDTANAVLLSILVCFTCLEQLYSYHDLLAIGCSFMILFLLGEISLDMRLSAIGLGLLSGFAATSRIVFLFVPGLLALLWLKRWKTNALLVGIIGTVTAAAIHLIGYLNSEFYPALHLIGRGFRLPPFLIGLGLLALGIAFLLFLRRSRDSFESRLTWMAVLLVIPMFVVFFGELIGLEYNLGAWEAAHYLLPAMPAAFYAVLGTRVVLD